MLVRRMYVTYSGDSSFKALLVYVGMLVRRVLVTYSGDILF